MITKKQIQEVANEYCCDNILDIYLIIDAVELVNEVVEYLSRQSDTLILTGELHYECELFHSSNSCILLMTCQETGAEAIAKCEVDIDLLDLDELDVEYFISMINEAYYKL